VTAFHGDYKMQNDVARDTTGEDLLRAVEIGCQSGLRYIYAGNLPGQIGEWEDTRCPQCEETLIKRYGYLIQDYRLTPEGRCPKCAALIPGRWSAHFEGQITSRPFSPRKRSLLFTIQNQ
jgi:pyruvate formate lyase activating enzyme